jgi:hypothetical protein
LQIKRFPDELLNGQMRTQRTGGVGKHQLDLTPHVTQIGRIELEQFMTQKPDSAGGHGFKPDKRAGEGGFSATAFACNPQRLIFGEIEADTADGLDD